MMTVYARKLSLNDCFFIFRPFPPHDFQLLNGPLNYSTPCAPPHAYTHSCFAENEWAVIPRYLLIRRDDPNLIVSFSIFALSSCAIWN